MKLCLKNIIQLHNRVRYIYKTSVCVTRTKETSWQDKVTWVTENIWIQNTWWRFKMFPVFNTSLNSWKRAMWFLCIEAIQLSTPPEKYLTMLNIQYHFTDRWQGNFLFFHLKKYDGSNYRLWKWVPKRRNKTLPKGKNPLRYQYPSFKLSLSLAHSSPRHVHCAIWLH